MLHDILLLRVLKIEELIVRIVHSKRKVQVLLRQQHVILTTIWHHTRLSHLMVKTSVVRWNRIEIDMRGIPITIHGVL